MDNQQNLNTLPESCGRNARRRHYCDRYFIVHWAELSDQHQCLKQYDDQVVAQAKAELERFEYEEMTGFDGSETPETPPVDGVCICTCVGLNIFLSGVVL